MLVASTLRQTFGLRLRLNQPTARTGSSITLVATPRFAERDLWNMGGPLDRFDPREFNYLGPFLGVFGDELAEVGR